MTRASGAVMPMAVSERVSIRVGASLVSNAARFLFSFGAGLLVARGLGASQYGRYQFLLASTASLSQFIDFGTSQAFFTFVAQRPRSRRFLALYGGWLALQFVAVVAAVGVLAPRSMIAALWVGEARNGILLAFAASFLMNELWEAISQLGEARRRTVRVQAALMLQAMAHLLLVGSAWYLHRLTTTLALVFIVSEYGTLVLVLGPAAVSDAMSEADDDGGPRRIAADFWTYCRPLVAYAGCGFALAFADRWLLQRYGGAEQQGFYGVAAQFSTVSLLATNSMLQVFWTETAAATAAGDRDRVILLFRSTSRALYFVGAWVSCLLIPYASEILRLTLGVAYTAGAAAFTLMLLYPIHQTLGRVYGAVMQASGETGAYSRIGVIVLILSLPITYFLIAPRSALLPGLGLGALGLAIKMVVVGIISVNLLAVSIARRIGAAWDWIHQVGTPALLLAIAYGCRALVHLVSPAIGPAGIVSAAAGASAYALISAGIVYQSPELVGLSRAQTASIVSLYRSVLAR